MSPKVANRRSERIRRRKETLFLKAVELGEFPGIDIAVYIFQNGQYSTFSSVEDGSWPPSMESVVRELDISRSITFTHEPIKQKKFPPTKKLSAQDIRKKRVARRAKKLTEKPKVII